jgi:hypothetical protein
MFYAGKVDRPKSTRVFWKVFASLLVVAAISVMLAGVMLL